MLNFQTDYDEHTGEQVLTCFLLPQMEYQNEENMGKDSRFLFSLNLPDKCRVELEQNLLWTSNVVSVLRVASKRPMKLRMPARGKECLASFFVSGEGTRTLLLSSYVVHTRCWEDKMQDIGDVHIVRKLFLSFLFPSLSIFPRYSSYFCTYKKTRLHTCWAVTPPPGCPRTTTRTTRTGKTKTSEPFSEVKIGLLRA